MIVPPTGMDLNTLNLRVKTHFGTHSPDAYFRSATAMSGVSSAAAKGTQSP
jgi:hypothetical protein